MSEQPAHYDPAVWGKAPPYTGHFSTRSFDPVQPPGAAQAHQATCLLFKMKLERCAYMRVFLSEMRLSLTGEDGLPSFAPLLVQIEAVRSTLSRAGLVTTPLLRDPRRGLFFPKKNSYLTSDAVFKVPSPYSKF